MANKNEITIGKRYLFRRHAGEADVHLGDAREFSPNGNFVNMGAGRWTSVRDIVIEDTLKDLEMKIIGEADSDTAAQVPRAPVVPAIKSPAPPAPPAPPQNP